MAKFSLKLLLLTFSLGLAFLASELVVRRFYPVDAGSSFQFRIPHPVLGWSLQPGASYINRLARENVRVTYNSRGFHDVEHDVARPEGTLRILVLGDSYMEAYSVQFSDSFHARLAEQAREAGIDLEVINLGVGGYGTLQEYLIFEEVGRHYKPDLVLLAFYPSNDVANNSIELERKRSISGIKIESRPFLDIEAGDEEWRVTRVDYEGAQRRYQAAREARGRWRLLRENSALLRFAWARLKVVRSKLASRAEGTSRRRFSRGRAGQPRCTPLPRTPGFHQGVGTDAPLPGPPRICCQERRRAARRVQRTWAARDGPCGRGRSAETEAIRGRAVLRAIASAYTTSRIAR